MSKQREALKIALNALTEVIGWQWVGPMRVMDEVEDAIEAIREALAEPEQEPVAWIMRNPPYEDGTPNPCNRIEWAGRNAEDDFESQTPLYTAPLSRKPLTDIELWKMWVESPSDVLRFARAIERAHGIGEA